MGRLQCQHAAQSAIDVGHQACGKRSGEVGEVGLVERNQCGDVDDRIPGNPVAAAGRKTLSGMLARAVLDVITAASVVVSWLSL
jgi:hypothetical protein